MRLPRSFALLLPALVAPSAHVRAADDYLFAPSTAAYKPLAAPTVVAQNALILTGAELQILIGFPFHYWGAAYTTFLPTTFGYGAFGSTDYGFYAFYAGLKGLGDSQVGYVLDASGGVGHRILKVEWTHMGFQQDATGTDYVNFQYWLREGSDQVEIHFGPSSVAAAHYAALFGSATGPQAVFDAPNGSSFYNLQGPAAMPTAVYHPATYLYLSGYAPAGTVYTYTPSVQAGIADTEARMALSLYPQPATDVLHVAVPGAPDADRRYTILDLNGRTVQAGRLSTDAIAVAQLPTGTYVLRVQDGARTWVARFLCTPR